jgi:drug/metabolite transporter superfamily protein YnfA
VAVPGDRGIEYGERAQRERDTRIERRLDGLRMRRHWSVIGHALAGWFVCGATVGVGRLVLSLHTTLILHAAVAPIAFGLLAWHHFRRYPDSPPAATALAMLSIVVGLDALLVAPIFERSYAMFGSLLGTWLPFLLIFVATYLVGRIAGRRAGS